MQPIFEPFSESDMRSTYRFLTFALLVTLFSACPAFAQNLLTAGDFEVNIVVPPEFPGWVLEEFVTGTGEEINSGAKAGFANSFFDADIEGDGLWLRAFVGGVEGTNFAGANVIFSQTVPATVGETYSFVGDSNFEANYSGGVEFLDGTSPIGVENGGTPQPTPTQSLFELEFLGVDDVVLATESLDLVNDDSQFSGGGWFTHTPVTGVAPAGTVNVRVSAKALDQVQNIDPGQSGFYDNFSLTAGSAPGTELLENADLNGGEDPPSAEELLAEVYEFIETPDTVNTIAVAGFANNPATEGATGVWVRPFAADGESAEVRQTVDGTAGIEYTFGASSRFELAYLGDTGDENETLIQLAFLSDIGEIIESFSLDLRDDGKTADDAWSTHSISGLAPAGTVQVAVSGIVNNLTNNEAGGAQSAFWDDFSLTLASIDVLFGDADNDLAVSGSDLLAVTNNFGNTGLDDGLLLGDADDDGAVSGSDLLAVTNNFGNTAGSGSVEGSANVPEPATLGMLTLVALCAAGFRVVRRVG